MTVTAALLLAAGGSQRFGAADKLLADFRGRPLVSHAARALATCPSDLRLAVVRSDEVGAVLRDEGFATLTIPPGPQSASIVAGVRHLIGQGAGRILIALGDMPALQQGDFAQLFARGPEDVAAIWQDGRPSPPAIFPLSWFARLCALTGDQGAGALLRDLPESARITLLPDHLGDIDRPEDLLRI